MQQSENIEKENSFLESVEENLHHYQKEWSLIPKEVVSSLSMVRKIFSLIEKGKIVECLGRCLKVICPFVQSRDWYQNQLLGEKV